MSLCIYWNFCTGECKECTVIKLLEQETFARMKTLTSATTIHATLLYTSDVKLLNMYDEHSCAVTNSIDKLLMGKVLLWFAL